MRKSTRRTFLKHSAAGLGTLCLAGGPLTARGLLAAEGAPPMKYAMCNETFVDWPQEKVFDFLAECGYGGVEIAPFTIDHDVTKITAARRAALKKSAQQAGIEIVGLHWLLSKTEGLHLTSPEKAVRRKTAEYLKALAHFCADLGGRVMIFGSPQQRNLQEGVSRAEGMQFAEEVLAEATGTLEDCQVVLALEPLGPNETNFVVTAADAVELAQRVDSPQCKMMLDCKAAITEDTPIPELIRQYGKWVVHFHANDPNLQGPGMGELDFGPIFAALKGVDFRGWVSVEVFDYTPGAERLAKESLAYMRKIETSG